MSCATWKLPLKRCDDIDSHGVRKKTVYWYEVSSVRAVAVNTQLLISPNSGSILALDNKVELAVLKKHPFKCSSDLVAKMGEPLVRYPLASGEIWAYGERRSTLIDRDQVAALWIAWP